MRKSESNGSKIRFDACVEFNGKIHPETYSITGVKGNTVDWRHLLNLQGDPAQVGLRPGGAEGDVVTLIWIKGTIPNLELDTGHPGSLGVPTIYQQSQTYALDQGPGWHEMQPKGK